MIKKFTQIAALLALVFNCTIVQAQSTGKIAGKITDKKNGETLIGATVLIDGTSKGAAANIDGNYIINGVSPGTYTLTVKYIGYSPKQISDVVVKGNAVTNLDVVLDAVANKTLETVIVKGTYKQESVNSLYAQQKNNAAITDGITSETIKRSPDKNTSEVLRRVSGATVQDNKFVVVRGLSDRYNTASLDGTALPSTEPNRKAFSFDIVPSNLVDNLIISKTATPNLPGDFAGGAIQIVTKDIPDQNFLTVSAAYGYNTNTTFKNFKSGYRNPSDYLGFDDGSRALPNNFPSSATIQAYTAAAGQQLPQTKALLALNPNFNIYNNNAFLNQNYQLTFGRVKDVGKNGNRLGAIIALTYRNAMQTTPDLGIDYHFFHFTDNRYKFSTNVGALANFAYSYGKNKITFKNIYNRIFDDQLTLREGKNDQAAADNNRFTAFDLVQKGLYKGTLQGDHGFANNKKFTWIASYSNVINSQPDQRKTNYALLSGVYKADIDAQGKQNARFSSELNENVYSGQLDYSAPVTLFKQKGTFKTGVSSSYRDRTFSPRFLVALENTGTSITYDPEFVKQLPLNQIFSRTIIAQDVYSLKDIVSASDPYKANTFTNAAYAMMDNKFGDKFRLVWGVRAEKFNLKLNDNDPTTGEVKLDDLDILPSANLTYALTSKANLRFSYSRTVGRPELRELAPFGYYDFELLGTVTGNQNLKSAHINNIDIRYEVYPSAGQIFSVSAFYKDFQNPIESGIYDVNSTPDFNFFNAQKAINYGVEFEVRKKLDFISPSLLNTTFYTNVAIIKSETTDSRFSVSENNNKRPMVGQAPYVINAGLLQTAYDNRLSINLLYNRVGERIFKARGNVFPAVYEKPRDVVDLQLGYKVFKNKGEFKFNASDILNNATTFFYKGDTQQYVINSNPSRHAIIANYKTGVNYTISYAHNF